MKQKLNILLLLAAAFFSLWCTGDLMRKNDQATILAGAYDLAHGRVQGWNAYYQYDKSYVLYWTCAAVLKLSGGGSPVVAGNLSLAIFFWAGLLLLVIRFGERLSTLALLCFLTAPAVLLNTLYLNSSLLSSAFLLLSALFIFQEDRRAEWPAALLFFLSVGSRADVVLLLPLLLWLVTPLAAIRQVREGLAGPRRGEFGLLTLFSKQGKLLFAAVAAVGLGLVLRGGAGIAVDPVFNLKMVGGYTVFGFGAAGLLFLASAIRLLWASALATDPLEKIRFWCGLFCLLLPVLFFLPQLHSPRYFWRGCEAVLLLTSFGHLPRWKFRWMKPAVCCAALLPLVVGVRLPSLTQPRLSFSAPELFPSGDGYYPMGGCLPFMMRLKRAADVPLDHNQLVWAAVHSAELDFSPNGTINVLRTPMFGYFMLEASLRNGVAHCLPFEQLGGAAFYADSRSLMRRDPKTPIHSLDRLLSLPARFVSPVYQGVGVLRFGEGGLGWGRRTALLNRLFAGNEYRILDPENAGREGRMHVVFSPRPFEGGSLDAATGLYYREGVSGDMGPGCSRAEVVWPYWMSMRSFSGK